MPMNATLSNAPGIAERMDRLPVTSLHVVTAMLCALGFMFDTMELALGNLLSAVFSTAPHVASAQELSFLIASVYAGAVIGAPLLGWCADRVGSRLTLSALLVSLALLSLAAASSQTIQSLTALRFLAGL